MKREIIYLLLHYHHQNDSCIKMGSDESHFNVSAGSDGQSHKTVSTNHNLLKRKESRSGIEPRSFRLPANALPLGQTGSPLSVHLSTIIYRLRCDVWRTIFVPKLCMCGQTVSPYHAIFKCPALADHFKSITDKLRRLNLPPDLSSLCRFRDDTGWGLAVDTATLIFTSGVAAHS